MVANKSLFKGTGSGSKMMVPPTNAVNLAGGVAYDRGAEESLAQIACTGTFNGTAYATGNDVLNMVQSLVPKVSDTFLAKLAVFSRESAYMKDMSAFLLAALMVRNPDLFNKVFFRVVDNGKMLKNFVQVVRSGVVGRKSFGSRPRRLIRNWLANRSDNKLFEDSVGESPSLADVIKMVHPTPANPQREALYGYLLGRKHNADNLPQAVKDYEAFKAAAVGTRTVPQNVSFQMLTSLNLSESEWKEVAKGMSWHATRMNLNTFERHNVFSSFEMVDLIAKKLSDKEAVKRSKVFPYQLFVAYTMATSVPMKVRESLQDAMEVAIDNIPSFDGRLLVAVDFSGSMNCPVTGMQGSASSKVTCNQVASLMASCFVRRSRDFDVLRFDDRAYRVTLNPRDSVITNAQKIGCYGGGTNCSAPVKMWNDEKQHADVVIIISDNESWCGGAYHSGTPLANEWAKFKARNPKAKLVLIDLAAGLTTQVGTSNDVLNIGGFSGDVVFETIHNFFTNNTANFISRVEAINLN